MEGEANWQRFDCPTLPSGWIREVVPRIAEGQKPCNNKKRVYYRSPSGKRVRSKPELTRYLGNTLDLSTFEWGTGNLNPNQVQPPKRKKPKVETDDGSERSSLVDISISVGDNSGTPVRHLGTCLSTPLPVKLPDTSSTTLPLPVKVNHTLPAPPVKLSKDWREKSGHTPLPASNPVKLGKDWKERAGPSPQSKCGKLSLVTLSKEAPVKLSKDWREKGGHTSSSTFGKSIPLKLPKKWKEGSLDTKHLGSDSVKNGNEKTNQVDKSMPAVKLPKDWRKSDTEETNKFATPIMLAKGWNKNTVDPDLAATPLRLAKDWQSADNEKVKNAVKLSKDWNKNLELSRRAFAVKLPKGWMEEALAEQRSRRLDRQSANGYGRDRRRDADCALVLPPAWDKLPPLDLINNLCSSAQAEKLSSQAKERLEHDLKDRLLEIDDQQASSVRLEKGWTRRLPPLLKGVDSQVPASLVLPVDWKEKNAESVAAELGITLPMSQKQEDIRILPKNWMKGLHVGGKALEVGKASKPREGLARKKKSMKTRKNKNIKWESGKPRKSEVRKGLNPDLCEYERIRLENILQREELFAQLNLGEAKANMLPKATKSEKRKATDTRTRTHGSKSEREVEGEKRRQLEMPGREGWKREVVISKVSFHYGGYLVT